MREILSGSHLSRARLPAEIGCTCEATALPRGRPVRVVVVVSDTDVTIKVADEGGGLPRSKLADIWSYKGGYWQDVISSASRGRGSIFEWQGVEPGRGSMGLGLPLSRIHAKCALLLLLLSLPSPSSGDAFIVCHAAPWVLHG